MFGGANFVGTGWVGLLRYRNNTVLQSTRVNIGVSANLTRVKNTTGPCKFRMTISKFYINALAGLFAIVPNGKFAKLDNVAGVAG
jgi:hypothetical protein